MSQSVKLALVILAAAAIYLIGNGQVALWDRDEPRNAQAARQMLQSGDWVVPHFLDEVRKAKPPFTAWCQATSMAIFGQNTFAARLPSGLAMTLTLIVLGIVLTRAAGAERAFWTVLILSTSAIVIAWSAKTSLTDAILLLWITIAQLCLFAIWRGRGSWKVLFIMGIALGLAGITKGPVVLGVLAMTLLCLWLGRLTRVFPQEKRGAQASPPRHDWFVMWLPRDIITLKILFTFAIVAAIALPWMILVEQRAPGFLRTTTSHDVVRRVFEPLEQHFGPPGYYAMVVWGIYFPWSVLLPVTFVLAWRNRRDAMVQFALAAIIGPWIMLEFVQTKLPHYLLPVFPALAFLTADALVRCFRGEHPDLLTRGTRGAIAGWSIIVVLIGLSPWLIARRFDLPAYAIAPLSIFALLYALSVFIPFHRLRPKVGVAMMGIGMMLTMAIAFGIYLPRAHFLRLSVYVADLLNQNGGGADHTTENDVQMIAYKEPSLAFYQGGTIRERTKNDFLVTHPPSEWPKWTVIREDIWAKMPDDVKSKFDVIGSRRGLVYADAGRTWTVYVLRKRDEAP